MLENESILISGFKREGISTDFCSGLVTESLQSREVYYKGEKTVLLVQNHGRISLTSEDTSVFVVVGSKEEANCVSLRTDIVLVHVFDS